MAFAVEILSKAEVEEIWRSKVRDENFAQYVDYLNRLDIGAGLRIPVEKGENNAKNAAQVRSTFNDAAKERVAGMVVDNVFVPTLDAEGKKQPAPVTLRWKTEAHDLVKKAKDGTETTTKIIDKIQFRIDNSEPVSNVEKVKRAPTEVVHPVNPPADVKAVTLPDGRIAKLSKSGAWRAEKLPPPTVAVGEAPTIETTNGVANDGIVADTTAETPEVAPVA